MAAKGAQPDAPQLPKTPLDLFTLREGEGFNLYDRYFLPFISGVAGLATPLLFNMITSRPLWSGAWLYVVTSATFYAVADFYTQHRIKERAEDYAVMKHYITLHPEDFPPYERTQIKYLFMPWRPFR